MKFPAWVESPPEQAEDARASKRLQYIIKQAAIGLVPDGSMSKFACLCAVDRTSMHTHIRNGSFSAAMAVAIEKAVGREMIRHEDLMRPLEIVAE